MAVLKGIWTQTKSFKIKADGIIEIVCAGNLFCPVEKSTGFLKISFKLVFLDVYLHSPD
jgi:hypothetical protein